MAGWRVLARGEHGVGVDIADDHIHVRMVLTMPGCPLAGYLVMQVKNQTEAVAEGRPEEVRGERPEPAHAAGRLRSAVEG